MTANIGSVEMVNNSVMASVGGIRRINAKKKEMMKEELVDFINRSGKHIVLDLHNRKTADPLAAVKVIIELAKVTELVSCERAKCENAFHDIELQAQQNNFVFAKN